MFNMQILYALCPNGGSINYQIDIPIRDATPDHVVTIKMPDGETKTVQPSNGVAPLEYRSGQGVWRFIADIADSTDSSTVLDSLIIDVVIIDESDEKTKITVSEAIAKMRPTHQGNSWSGDQDIRAEAVELYKGLRGKEIPEVLRLLCFDTTAPLTNHWRRVLLLKECLTRLEARPYFSSIVALAADLLCEAKWSSIAQAEFDMIIQAAISPQQKWIYLLKVFASMDPMAPFNNRSGLGEVTQQLTGLTPPEYRNLVIKTAENRLNLDTRTLPHVGAVYVRYNHREGIPQLLSALELDLTQVGAVCGMLRTLNYRESVDRMRAILPMTNNIELIRLLSEWKDVASIPLMLEKLQAEFGYNIDNIVIALKSIGDKSIIPRIEEIASASPDDKETRIRNILKTWT